MSTARHSRFLWADMKLHLLLLPLLLHLLLLCSLLCFLWLLCCASCGFYFFSYYVLYAVVFFVIFSFIVFVVASAWDTTFYFSFCFSLRFTFCVLEPIFHFVMITSFSLRSILPCFALAFFYSFHLPSFYLFSASLTLSIFLYQFKCCFFGFLLFLPSCPGCSILVFCFQIC